MAESTKYKIVGRYMDGSTVTAYHLVDSKGGSRKATREQVIFLVGRGDVINCAGQLNNDGVVLRGIGMSLIDLPVVNEKTGNLKQLDNACVPHMGVPNPNIPEKYMIIGKIIDGTNVVGFTLQNQAGITRGFRRDQVEKWVREKRIVNATFDYIRGVRVLKLLNCRIEDLPITGDISHGIGR